MSDDFGERSRKHLAENPHDVDARLIYADWLWEAGDTIESDRQRDWAAARQFLIDLADRYNKDNSYYDDDDSSWYGKASFERLIHIGETVEDGDGYGNVSELEDLRDGDYLDREYWKNWSIITGRPIPFDMDGEWPYFSCGC